MSKPVIFVIGATGNIGAATVQALSNKYAGKFDIRAGVRDPSKADKLRALAGVTVVQAAQGDKDSLVDVFKGVDALYMVTPSTNNRAELVVKTAEAAKTAGVKFLLAVSLPSADLTDTYFGKQFNEIETGVKNQNVGYAFIRLPFFYENFLSLMKDMIESESIRTPVDPSKPFTSIVAEDAGKASAAVLADWQKHVGKAYTIVSERHSFDFVASTISEALGKNIKHVRVSYEEAKKSVLDAGAPDWQVNGLVDWYKQVDSGSHGANQVDIGDFERLTGEKPTSLKTWLSAVAGDFK